MILGIIGKKGSGKTTLANYLIKHWNDDNKLILKSFANPLKEMLLTAGICNEDELWNKKTDYSRKMLQLIGTNLIRYQIDNDFWVKKMDNEIEDNLNYVIDDVRFLNEAKFIKDKNGLLIRIIRFSDEINNQDSHASEREQDHIIADFSIDNKYDLQILEYNVIYLLDRVKK